MHKYTSMFLGDVGCVHVLIVNKSIIYYKKMVLVVVVVQCSW
jgi:hypothetical protein